MFPRNAKRARVLLQLREGATPVTELATPLMALLPYLAIAVALTLVPADSVPFDEPSE